MAAAAAELARRIFKFACITARYAAAAAAALAYNKCTCRMLLLLLQAGKPVKTSASISI